MISLGFSYSYSDAVVPGTAFPFPSMYIYVGTTGNIVWRAPDGSNQWLANAAVGYHPIATSLIVTSGLVNGVNRTTTAAAMSYCSAPKY